MILERKSVLWDTDLRYVDPVERFGVELEGLEIIDIDANFIVGHKSNSAFRWTEETGLIQLPRVNGDGSFMRPQSVSPDGSIIVGRCCGTAGFAWAGPGALIWTEEHGTRVVQDVLEEAGLRGELENWFLVETTGLSNNGRVLWGTGINPDGIVEAWVATVPEPKIHGAIFVLLLVLRRRWRTV